MTKAKKRKPRFTKLTEKVKEDVRTLAKKNFIILKIKEVVITALSILGIVFLPYLSGLCYFKYFDYTLEEFCEVMESWGSCGVFDVWAMGLIVTFCSALTIGLIFLIGWGTWAIIKGVIDKNWDKAYTKAEEELKVKPKDYNWWDNTWWKKRYGKDKEK